MGDVFKALADPTRRALLDELQERNGQTLFELCARLIAKHGSSSSRQAVSQHLAVLEQAGLVHTRRQGRYKFHHVDGRAGRARRGGGAVQLSRDELVRVLRTEGDNDTADAVAGQLPAQVDTDRDADALTAVGLDRTKLMAKLAGGSLGTTLSP